MLWITGRTGEKGVVVLDDLGRKAVPVHFIVPALLDGPALDPLDQAIGSEHDVDRDDDEPDEEPHLAGRDSEEGDGERRLAPARGEDGTEAGAHGVQGDGSDLVDVQIGVVPAQTVGDADGLENDRGDEGDLDVISRQRDQSRCRAEEGREGKSKTGRDIGTQLAIRTWSSHHSCFLLSSLQ